MITPTQPDDNLTPSGKGPDGFIRWRRACLGCPSAFCESIPPQNKQVLIWPRFPLDQYETSFVLCLHACRGLAGRPWGWGAGFNAGSASRSGWNQVDPLTCSGWDRRGARISPHYRGIDHSQQERLWIIDAPLLDRSLRSACVCTKAATVPFSGYLSRQEGNYTLHVLKRLLPYRTPLSNISDSWQTGNGFCALHSVLLRQLEKMALLFHI